MNGQVSHGSVFDYQADEQASVAGFSGDYQADEQQVSRGSGDDYQADEQARVAQLSCRLSSR